jgi:rhamnosyltransferase
MNNNLLNEFGKPENEGYKFIKSELLFLLDGQLKFIPLAVIKNIFKYIGFTMGKKHHLLTKDLKIRMSMNKKFWNN